MKKLAYLLPVILLFTLIHIALSADQINFEVAAILEGLPSEVGNPIITAADENGNVYVGELISRDGVFFPIIRRIDKSGQSSILAGLNGKCPSKTDLCGDGGQATEAKFTYIYALAIDSSGNIYIADDSKIRKIDKATGNIATIAGGGTNIYGEDVPATSLILSGISAGGMAIDSSGNIYISEGFIIRRIDAATNTIRIIAGKGSNAGYNGDNIEASSALFLSHFGLAVDSSDNLYIADAGNNRIRKIDKGGIITTVIGTGARGDPEDGKLAAEAMIGFVKNIAIDSLDNLYFTDQTTKKIKKMDFNTKLISTVFAGDQSVSYLSLSVAADPNAIYFTEGYMKKYSVKKLVYNPAGGSSNSIVPTSPSPIYSPPIPPTPPKTPTPTPTPFGIASPTATPISSPEPPPPSPEEILLDLYRKEPDMNKRKRLIPAIGEIKTDNAFILLASDLRRLGTRDMEIRQLLTDSLKKQGPEADQIISDVDKKEVCLNENFARGIFNIQEPVIKMDKIDLVYRPSSSNVKNVYLYDEKEGWKRVEAPMRSEKVARRIFDQSMKESRIVVYDAIKQLINVQPSFDLKKGFILLLWDSNREFFIGNGGQVFNTLDEAKVNPISFVGPAVCDLNAHSDKYKLSAPEAAGIGDVYDVKVEVSKTVSPPPKFIPVDKKSSLDRMVSNLQPTKENSLIYKHFSPQKIKPTGSETGIDAQENDYITTSMGGQVVTTIIGNPDLPLDRMNFVDPNIEPIARAFEAAFPQIFGSVGAQRVVVYAHENSLVPDTRKISFEEKEHAKHEDGDGLSKEINLGLSGFVSSVSYSLCSAGKTGGGKRNIASASFDIELYKGGDLVDSKTTDWKGEKYSGECPDIGSFLFNKFADKVKVVFREKDKETDYTTHYGDVSVDSYQFDSKSKGLEIISFAIENSETKSAYFGGVSNPTFTISATKNFINYLSTLEQEDILPIVLTSIINKEIIISDNQGNNLFKNIAGSTDKAVVDVVKSVLDDWSVAVGESKKIAYNGETATLKAVNYNGQTIKFVVAKSKQDRGTVIISTGIPTDVCIVNPDNFPSGLSTGQSSIVDCSSLDQQIIPISEFGPPAPPDFFFSGALAGSTSSQEQYQMLYFNGPQTQELSPGGRKVADVKGIVLSSGDRDLPEEKSFKVSFEKSGSEEDIPVLEKSFFVDKIADKLKITSRSPSRGMAKIFYTEKEELTCPVIIFGCKGNEVPRKLGERNVGGCIIEDYVCEPIEIMTIPPTVESPVETVSVLPSTPSISPR